MSGLDELFAAEEQRSMHAVASARPEDAHVESVRHQVRRAHARRSATRASMVALAAAVVGIGGVFLAQQVRDEPAPATPPSSPSPSVTPSEGAAIEWAQAPPMTEELWSTVGPGWVLLTVGAEADRESAADVPVYLVDPAGEVYLVTTVAGDRSVRAWNPGDRQAWFSAFVGASLVSVDLENGSDVPVPEWFAQTGLDLWDVLPDGRLSGVNLGESNSFVEGSDTYIVGPEGTVLMPTVDGSYSPDGAYLASGSGVVDTRTGELTALTGYEDEGRCYSVGWYDAATLSIACGVRDDASGLVYSDGSVLLGDVLTGELREAPWPEQPGDPLVDTWVTTAYLAVEDGAVLAGAGTDVWAGLENPNRHEPPPLPSRSQPMLLTADADLRMLAVPGVEPECAALISPRGADKVLGVRDLCAEGVPSLGGLFRLQGGELVPAFDMADVLGDVPGAGITGWAD